MKKPLFRTDDENPPVGKDRVLSIFDNRFILFSNLFSTFGNGFTVSENLSVFNPYVNSECRRQKKGKNKKKKNETYHVGPIKIM